MKKFSDFGIKTSLQSFTGDKIKMARVLNRDIEVHDYKLEDTKIPEATNKKCLYLQISIEGVKYVVFTGSSVLIETIQQVPKGDFPFATKIIKDNERYEFT
jgi:hypothetical protein